MATSKLKNSEFSTRKTRCAVSVYLMDHLEDSKRLEFLENMYGGKLIAHRSAKVIQRCFRRYLKLKTMKTTPTGSVKFSFCQKNGSLTDQRVSDLSVDSVDADTYNPNDPFALDNDENRKNLYFMGKNLFNKNCNKGINFLIKHGILECDGSSILKFFNSQGLSSYSKGDFMSQDNNPLAIATRKEFMSKMSFHNCSIESGVRLLFSKIRIPGETQKILNMLEEFHTVYLNQNIEVKKMLKNEDTVVLLSFAILMVHTSLHNPNATKQDKMSKEQFIKIFKGVNNEDFVNETYLGDLYDNIKKKQMKSLSDHTDLVRNIYSHLTGPLLPKDLIQNHRKHICKYDCNEIPNINKKQKSHTHSRAIFLFNDLLLVTKPIHSNSEFHVRHVIPLLGVIINQFQTEHYPISLEIIKPECKKPIMHFDCITSRNRDKMVADIKVCIEEVKQLNQLFGAKEVDHLHPSTF